jgi:hypothetical protein
MYGLLTSFFWIGLVAAVIAMAFLPSPLLGLIVAVIAGVGLLIAAGLKRAGEQSEHAGETARRQEGPCYPAAWTRRGGGAPVSGEGDS